MRVVLDTNIFISAVLGGRLMVIIDEWKAGKFILIITDAIAREYIDVIKRPGLKSPQAKLSQPQTIFYKPLNLLPRRRR